ncbi:MAG: UDP-N-acetylmuramoyl-L-alanyl-D-glutamate--2,6-diaminopimelate ligase [Victivallaceae bacterium]|nr:UDP-N-acetylmuramoyl-L-alanyl-D-glutamate--2,6-diaminopimelate ligase [Victivallaceae bacterium]
MKLESYAAALDELFVAQRGFDGIFRGQVRCDSRKILPGDAFVAISGAKLDGHEFIDEAIRRGAQTIVHTRELASYCSHVSFVQVTDATRAYSRLVREFWRRPDEKLPLIGVTGTNGKTTTAFLVEHLFRASGTPCGLISTVEYRDGKITMPASNTTPEAGVLFPMLDTMRRNGMKAAVMELSSHALDQGRVDGVKFHTAIFTNLTGDHLDYHKDMESYYRAKRLLFTELFAPDGVAVINIDDPYGRRLIDELGGRNIISFGCSAGASCRITNVELDADKSLFRLESEAATIDVVTNLIGEHNVHNLAGAIIAANNYGLSIADIKHALAQPIQVPGRLQKYTAPSGADFYVDYAHTDDALKNVLGILKKLVRGKLWVVFGAGGDRDRTKRPRMGRVAAGLADKLVLTSDNPRGESPDAIIAEIAAGIPETADCMIEPDRRRAIEYAFANAGAGDIVLVAGKGHENYQEIKGVRHHFDDREIIHDLINKAKFDEPIM